MTLPNEADIKCPKCADIMIITKIEGIEVEKCIGCKGIFLDGGEIDKIRERIRQRGEGGVHRVAHSDEARATPCAERPGRMAVHRRAAIVGLRANGSRPLRQPSSVSPA